MMNRLPLALCAVLALFVCTDAKAQPSVGAGKPFTVAWDASVGATGYVCVFGNQRVTVAGDVLRCVLTAPTEIGLYVVGVAAVNGGGESFRENTTFFVSAEAPPQPPPQPTPITLTVSGSISATSTDGQPVAVLYPAPLATGGVPPLSVGCTPASGSLFPVGSTLVLCHASDAIGQTKSAAFAVTVAFTAPPPPPPPPPPDPCVGNPLVLTINRNNGWPSSATGSQLRWTTNRPASVTFNPFTSPWTATATDGRGCSATVTR